MKQKTLNEARVLFDWAKREGMRIADEIDPERKGPGDKNDARSELLRQLTRVFKAADGGVLLLDGMNDLKIVEEVRVHISAKKRCGARFINPNRVPRICRRPFEHDGDHGSGRT